MTYNPTDEIAYVARAKFGEGTKTTPRFRFAADVSEWVTSLVYGLEDALTSTEWLVLASSPQGQAPWRVIEKIWFTSRPRDLANATSREQRRGYTAKSKRYACYCCELPQAECRYN